MDVEVSACADDDFVSETIETVESNVDDVSALEPWLEVAGIDVDIIPRSFAEIDGVVGFENRLLALDGGSRPGILTGKHFDGRGLEEDHSGVDQGKSWFPTLASNLKSTSILASLSTLTPVFEAPSSELQTPLSSISTRSVLSVLSPTPPGKRIVPDTALSVTLASGKLTVTNTSTFPICFMLTPNLIPGCEVALKVTEADALLRRNIGVRSLASKPVAKLALWFW